MSNQDEVRTIYELWAQRECLKEEIEELKKLIRKNREALSHYANRMGSGGTARRAIEEIDEWLEKA